MLPNLSILAAEAAGAVAEEEASNPIIPEGKEILWAFVFLALTYVAMRYVLLPPLQRMVRERDDTIRNDLAAAEKAREERDRLRAEYDAALAGARAEANQLLAQAKAEADEHRARLQADADAEIATLRRQAQEEIAAAREQALVSVRNDVVELAVGAASAVIQAPVDRATAVAVVEQALRGDGRNGS